MPVPVVPAKMVVTGILESTLAIAKPVEEAAVPTLFVAVVLKYVALAPIG